MSYDWVTFFVKGLHSTFQNELNSFRNTISIYRENQGKVDLNLCLKFPNWCSFATSTYLTFRFRFKKKTLL
jgi:hypothetical protein